MIGNSRASCGASGSLQGIEEVETILSHHLGIGLTFGRVLGQTCDSSIRRL